MPENKSVDRDRKIKDDREQTKTVSVPEIEQYDSILSRAAEKMDGLDYANSTTEHARIGIGKIFDVSDSEVNIFSTRFDGGFWKNLWQKIDDFLSKEGASLSLITILSPDDEAMDIINRIKSAYPESFSCRKLNGDHRRIADEIPNFITGDGKCSRFEESDSDAKKGFVSAVLNFGDTEKAERMNLSFRRLLDSKSSSKN